MSNCIIQIKIGDNIITLDPNANLSPDDTTSLSSAIDVIKLRSLFASLKEDVDLEGVVTDTDKALATKGEIAYNRLKESSDLPSLTPLASLIRANEDEKVAIKAYIRTLDASEVHESGDFFASPENAYKLSPYSIQEIQSLFNRDSNELSLFKELMSIPGMSTLRISIAVRDSLNGVKLTNAKGVYMTPDNIVQIFVPPHYYIRGAQGKLTVKNFNTKALEDIRNNILHEVTHAVYSELYLANAEFKASVNLLHESFVAAMRRAPSTRDNALAGQYSDVHEFMADMFVSKKLRSKLATLPSVDTVPTDLEHGNLYNTFTRVLSDKLRGDDKLLGQTISLLDTSIPSKYVADSFDKVIEDYVSNKDRQHTFFSDGIDEADITARISPRDQVDSYGGINAKAFWIQKLFTQRHDVADNKYTIRDAFYHKSIEEPTSAQLDMLHAQDLVKIPWLKYVKKVDDLPGKWQEQGVLTKNGKDLLVGGKIVIVDITRGKDGEIIQDDKRGLIQARTKLVPVVFSNSKKQTVTLAKTGLTEYAENGFNTISLPYSMITGIRKFNNEYFNHNEDFESELKSLKADRKRVAAKSDNDNTVDELSRIDKNIENVEKSIVRAEEIKQTMIDYFKSTSFSYKDGENIIMQVTESDYRASNFKKDDIKFRSFVNEDEDVLPLYVINKDRDGKFRSRPNPKVFRTLWEGNSGAAFITDSENVSEAVTRGDMVRVNVKVDFKQDGEDISIRKDEWLPIFQRLPNGIEVATAKGKGMIIPYNKISAYAKNMQTESFIDLVSRVEKVANAFEAKLYVEDTEDGVASRTKRKYNKEYAKEGLKYTSLQFSPEYNVKADEAIEEAMLRFDSNLKYIKEQIIPYETFVKVKRKYFDAEADVIDEDNKKTGKKGVSREYQTNDLVVARAQDGLVVMNNQGKYLRFEYIPFKQTLADKETTGSELAFVLQDLTAVGEVWQEFQGERDSYEKVKDVASWVNEGTKDAPKYKPAFDWSKVPRNARDVYDMYDNADGVKISRLRRGDVIAIKLKRGKDTPEDLPDFYYRKVVSVHENGNVTVAEYNNKEVNTKKGYTFKEGAYGRIVKPEQIVKVGYKKMVEQDGKQVLRDDLLERRAKLLEYAMKDKDWDDFNFTTKQTADKFNSNRKSDDGWYRAYVPLTQAVLDYNGKDVEFGSPMNLGSAANSVYLSKKLVPVETKTTVDDGVETTSPVRPDEVAYVMAWFKDGMMINTLRGLAANTTTFKAEDITIKVGEYQKIMPEFLAEIMPGDWAVRKYRDKSGNLKHFAALIDRIEGGKIYVINSDNTTSVLPMNGLSSIKTSIRNDKFSGFKRSKRLLDIIKGKTEQSKPVKKKAKQGKSSLEADYKSPADSQRAIYEVGSRFQQLNPDVKINYLTLSDVDSLRKELGYDYYNARAFVLGGEVNINLERASVSDVIHEYAHLFLHALKYENTDMYNAIVNLTTSHPLYNRVAQTYSHLQGEDLNEEVFVTVLGEYLNGQLAAQDEKWMDNKKGLILEFAEYTKRKLSATMNQEVNSIYDLDAGDVMSMNFEDVINLMGDELMKNRISNLYEVQVKFNRTLERLKQDLMERNQLTQECYG